MTTPTKRQFLASRRREKLNVIHLSLLDLHLDLIDDGREDFRDLLGDLISRPDSDEPGDFAPLTSRERF